MDRILVNRTATVDGKTYSYLETSDTGANIYSRVGFLSNSVEFLSLARNDNGSLQSINTESMNCSGYGLQTTNIAGKTVVASNSFFEGVNVVGIYDTASVYTDPATGNITATEFKQQSSGFNSIGIAVETTIDTNGSVSKAINSGAWNLQAISLTPSDDNGNYNVSGDNHTIVYGTNNEPLSATVNSLTILDDVVQRYSLDIGLDIGETARTGLEISDLPTTSNTSNSGSFSLSAHALVQDNYDGTIDITNNAKAFTIDSFYDTAGSQTSVSIAGVETSKLPASNNYDLYSMLPDHSNYVMQTQGLGPNADGKLHFEVSLPASALLNNDLASWNIR